ncbi:TPR-like protein, partial [Panus rudis PR-1116 ss-1]
LQDADELKTEGNEHFRAKRWEEALASYRSALGYLPKRKELKHTHTLASDATQEKGKGKERASNSDIADDEQPDKPATSGSESPASQPSSLQIECSKSRAILNGNISACYVMLGDHKAAVASCTEALADDPKYVKVLQRRASSNEQINTWASLSSAKEVDYELLLELLPASQTSGIRRSLAQLKPRLEAAQKQETDEMLDKLKGLGNSILGNFGLSTDNFQFTPNGQGGYSLNFTR